MKTARIRTKSGIVDAEQIATFTHTVGGYVYRFLITRQDLQAPVVTHRDSGMAVAHLSAVRKPTVEDAKKAIDEKVTKHGAARVRVVLDSAPTLAMHDIRAR